MPCFDASAKGMVTSVMVTEVVNSATGITQRDGSNKSINTAVISASLSQLFMMWL